MAAKVYALPDGLDEPELVVGDGRPDVNAYFEQIKQHRERVAEWVREHSDSQSPLVGETIRFPIADGYAEYMVYRTKPLELIHLPYVDAYHADAITLRGLRLSDVKTLVEHEHKLAELFGRAEA